MINLRQCLCSSLRCFCYTPPELSSSALKTDNNDCFRNFVGEELFATFLRYCIGLNNSDFSHNPRKYTMTLGRFVLLTFFDIRHTVERQCLLLSNPVRIVHLSGFLNVYKKSPLQVEKTLTEIQRQARNTIFIVFN